MTKSKLMFLITTLLLTASCATYLKQDDYQREVKYRIRDQYPKLERCARSHNYNAQARDDYTFEIFAEVNSDGLLQALWIDSLSPIPEELNNCFIDVVAGIQFPKYIKDGLIKVRQPIKIYHRLNQ